MATTPSMARQFFDSSAFGDWKKMKESELKIQVATVNRLNDVIRAIHATAKVRRG